jgi:hypothetical protein
MKMKTRREDARMKEAIKKASKFIFERTYGKFPQEPSPSLETDLRSEEQYKNLCPNGNYWKISNIELQPSNVSLTLP